MRSACFGSVPKRQQQWRLRDPHQEHRVDAFKACIKGFRNSQISAHHLNLWRQTSRVRIARHRADLRARGYQLRNNLVADVAGCSDDEDTIHAVIL